MAWPPPRPPRWKESRMDVREFLQIQDAFWRRIHARPCSAWAVLLAAALAVILAALWAAL